MNMDARTPRAPWIGKFLYTVCVGLALPGCITVAATAPPRRNEVTFGGAFELAKSTLRVSGQRQEVDVGGSLFFGRYVAPSQAILGVFRGARAFFSSSALATQLSAMGEYRLSVMDPTQPGYCLNIGARLGFTGQQVTKERDDVETSETSLGALASLRLSADLIISENFATDASAEFGGALLYPEGTHAFALFGFGVNFFAP